MEIKIKNKLLKILPYWLIGIILATNVAVFPYSRIGTYAIADTIEPKVLGAVTETPSFVRGPELSEKSIIQQVSPVSLNKISAQSFLVFDLDSGQELLSKNENLALSIASLTKLMTALVAYENSDLNSDFKVGYDDVLNISPSLGLKPNDTVKSLDVFNTMLVGSSNDAALAISHFVEQSSNRKFVELMNEKAKTLGMLNTSFANPLGFDSKDNFSTSEDLKKLISFTQNLSVFTDLGRREFYKFTGNFNQVYYAKATNQLIKNHPDILAIKTGYTNFAGGAMATKFIKNGHKIIILVLDSQDREGDTLKIKSLVETNFQFGTN
jgi:D-alanyl-D-alanine carboxypeptidase